MQINIPEGKYLIALSGGADSVALLCLLHDLPHVEVTAAHCNFHLRGEEADRDEQFCKNLCEQLGVPLLVKHFDTRSYAKEHGIGIEMAARELRYDWFESMLREGSFYALCVAHHRDDQVETVLLNLVRGTGLRGLAGMRRQNGNILRPLLDYSRQDILDYLASRNQEYVTDSTNLERDTARNCLRLDVIPLLKQINPKAVEHIAKLADRVQASVDNMPETEMEWDSEQAMFEWLHPFGFTSAQIEDMWTGRDGASGALWESATHRVLRNRGAFLLEEKRNTEEMPQVQQRIEQVDNALDFVKQQSLTPNHAYLDADKVKGELVLRHAQVGDRFYPFGMKGSKLLSDFLTDQKFSLFQKEKQWLLCDDEAIVWVIGVRSDNRYRVTEKTKRVLCLSLGNF